MIAARPSRTPATQRAGCTTPRAMLPGRTAGGAVARQPRPAAGVRRVAPHPGRVPPPGRPTRRGLAPPAATAQEPDEPAFSPTAAVGLLLWAGFLAYALFLSPNQTPARDAIFVQKLSGLGEPGAPPVNAVFTSLWAAMGAWPAVYAALLIPAGRSKTGLPAWPFVTGSFALGAFALLPYFALHVPGGPAAAAPPPASELESSRGLRVLESRWLALGLTGLAAWSLFTAAAAGPDAWAAYGRLFDESRLVHVTTLDFLTLTACAWTWVRTDAAARKFDAPWVGPLCAVPLLGPALYLCLRPRAGGEGGGA